MGFIVEAFDHFQSKTSIKLGKKKKNKTAKISPFKSE